MQPTIYKNDNDVQFMFWDLQHYQTWLWLQNWILQFLREEKRLNIKQLYNWLEFTYVITEGSQMTDCEYYALTEDTVTVSDWQRALTCTNFYLQETSHSVFKGPLPQISHVLIKTVPFNLFSLFKASCFAIFHNSMQFAK